ncbi:hypothetical protein DMENIID0001_019680 [Sergentomyia squamirostris]
MDPFVEKREGEQEETEDDIEYVFEESSLREEIDYDYYENYRALLHDLFSSEDEDEPEDESSVEESLQNSDLSNLSDLFETTLGMTYEEDKTD